MRSITLTHQTNLDQLNTIPLKFNARILAHEIVSRWYK